MPVFGKSLFLPIILGVIIICVGNVQARFKELDSLRPGQLKSLADFKKAVLPLLTQEWMKEDIYLIKYLSFNRFNIPKSVDHLKESLKWREDYNIDEELRISPDGPSKNYADLQKDYPNYVDAYDKEGRPICDSPFGSWDIRKAALAGKTKRLIAHHLINCYERAEAKIREQQARGYNVTQWVYLANMGDFQVATHLCPSCVPMAVAMTAGIDKYFPNSPHGFWLPNTPDAFNTLLRLVRPVMTSATRAAIKSFSSDENEWKPFFYKRIDKNQLATYFGGPKERH